VVGIDILGLGLGLGSPETRRATVCGVRAHSVQKTWSSLSNERCRSLCVCIRIVICEKGGGGFFW